MDKNNKTLKDVIDDLDRSAWGDTKNLPNDHFRENADPTQKSQEQEVEIPIEQLKLVKVGSIRYKVPKSPFTSPDHALSIFRAFFEGADREIVAVICLTSQNEFISLVPVAYGSIDHVHVTPREFFKRVLAQFNAASFIVAHNHPSGNPEPSQEDFSMMVEIRDEGARLDCTMNDFMIIGREQSYYSHRELHYGKGF